MAFDRPEPCNDCGRRDKWLPSWETEVVEADDELLARLNEYFPTEGRTLIQSTTIPGNIAINKLGRCTECNQSHQRRVMLEEEGRWCVQCTTLKSPRSFPKGRDNRTCHQCLRVHCTSCGKDKAPTQFKPGSEICIPCSKLKVCHGECGERKGPSEYSGRENICKKCKAKYARQKYKQTKQK